MCACRMQEFGSDTLNQLSAGIAGCTSWKSLLPCTCTPADFREWCWEPWLPFVWPQIIPEPSPIMTGRIWAAEARSISFLFKFCFKVQKHWCVFFPHSKAQRFQTWFMFLLPLSFHIFCLSHIALSNCLPSATWSQLCYCSGLSQEIHSHQKLRWPQESAFELNNHLPPGAKRILPKIVLSSYLQR